MPLPVLDQPLFPITIPSTKKQTKFRPFTVKEEKILLIAQESKETDQIIESIKQIVGNCVQNVDPEKLAMFDLEYLLINIRSKSVSNLANFTIKDPSTNEEIELEIDINDISIKETEGHTPKVPLRDGMYLQMRYPTINELKKVMSTEDTRSKNEALFEIMMGCIDSVITEDEVLKLTDFSENEVNNFLESLSAKDVENIQHFFETIPVLRYEKKYKNSKGEEHSFVMEGLESFFT